MKPFQVVWLPSARAQLQKISALNSDAARQTAEQVQSLSQRLSDSPQQPGKQQPGGARLVQAGSWQVLYRVDEADSLVTVLGVKPK